MSEVRLSSGPEDAEGEAGEQRASVTLTLPRDVRDHVTRNGRDTLAAAVRGLIRDRVTLFDIPTPALQLLERDMARHRIPDQRAYVVWLLLERYRALASEE